MPRRSKAAVAKAHLSALRRVATSAHRAYQGKNAARKRRNTGTALRTFARQAKNTYKEVAPLVSAMIKGSGDYKVGRGITGHNVAHMGGSRKPHHHARVSLEKGEMVIEHSEYIGDLLSTNIVSSANFLSQSYAINPGNAGTFPWLSGTAINFQHYQFDKLVFEYRPLVSESTASTAATLLSMGSVIMATQYNSCDGPYPNKQTMAESDFAITTKPSEHILHAVECVPKFNPLGVLFVSPSLSLTVGQNGSSDVRMQNLGIFQIASSNIPVASPSAIDLGEIWVHYKVKLFKPQLNAGLTSLLSAHYWSTSTGGAPVTTTPFGANITNALQPAGSTYNVLQLLFIADGTIYFPLAVTTGCFLVCYYCKGAGATVNYNAPTAVQNCSILQIWNNGITGQIDQLTIAGAPQTLQAGDTTFMYSFIVSINAPGSSLAACRINTLVVPTAGQMDIFVTPWNSGILA